MARVKYDRVGSLENRAFNHFTLLPGWNAQYVEST